MMGAGDVRSLEMPVGTMMRRGTVNKTDQVTKLVHK